MKRYKEIMSEIAKPIIRGMDVEAAQRNAILGFGFWHVDEGRFLNAMMWFFDGTTLYDNKNVTLRDYCDRTGKTEEELRQEVMRIRPDAMKIMERLICAGEPDEFLIPKNESDGFLDQE